MKRMNFTHLPFGSSQLLFAVFLLFLTLPTEIFAQCTSSTQFGSASANNTGVPQTLTTCAFGGEYSLYSGVVAGNTYTFTATGGAGNFLTIRQTNGTGTLVTSGLSPVTVVAPASGTLAIVVYTSSACVADSDCHNITANLVLPPPINDACAGALPLTPAAVPVLTAGTSIGATSSGVVISACNNFTSSSALDVWYSFTASGTNAYTVNLAATFDGVIAVYSGTCAAPVFVGCVDAATGTESLSLGQLPVGNYFTRIYGWAGAAGNFNVSVVQGSALPPINDACTSSATLTPAAAPILINGTTTNGTASSTPIPTCSGFTSNSALDVWYNFTAASLNSYIVNLAPTFDGIVAVYSGTCTAPVFVSCTDVGFGPTPETLTLGGLIPGNYLVRVYGWNGASGNFTVGVAAAACGITMQCPNTTVPGTFSCTNPIPAPVTTVAAFNALGANIGGTPCGTVVISSVTGTPNFCTGGIVTRTYTVFDDLNTNGVLNTGEQSFVCTQNFTVSADVTPPSITCPTPPAAVSCVANIPAGLPFTGTASDNCGTPTITFAEGGLTTFSCVNRFTYPRTYTATDACGRTATCSVLITVNDQTPPTITCPANIANAFACASAVPAPTPLTVVATDNCGGSGTAVAFVDDVISNQVCANKYDVVRTYRATDACGNTALCTQTISINDNVAPTITCPAGSTLACSSQLPGVLPFLGTSSDNCTNGTTVTGTEISYAGTCFDPLTKVRNYTATDACGNTATCQQIIRVAPQLITQPANITLDACFNDVDYMNWINNRGGATYSCNATFNWEWEEYDYVQLTCPQLRGWKVRFTGTDAAGAVICFSANVTVVEEGAPIWDMLPMNKTVNCSDANAGASINMWLASNGGAWLLDCGTQLNQLVTTNNYASLTCGANVVTFTATDLCGNSSTATAMLTVVDNTAPVISNVPANVTITCPATPVFGTPTATDACGTPTLTFTDVTMGACPAMSMVVRTWRATDACGNTATATSKITINPSTVNPPNTGVLTFNCPSNITVTAAASATSAIVNWTAPTASTTCTTGSTTVLLTSSLASGAAFPIGTSTVTYAASDACGNLKTCSFTVTVNSSTVNPPNNPNAITFSGCSTNQTVNAAAGATSAVITFSNPTATSTCTIGSVSVVRTSPIGSGGSFPLGTTNVIFTATDGCGNTSTCSFSVTVNPTTVNPPNPNAITLNVPPNQSIGCGQTAQFGTATASSTCTTGSSNVTFVDATTGSACTGFTATRTFTATDGCGNTKTGQQVITIAGDVSAPSFTSVPNSSTVACGAAITFGSATANDLCGSTASNVPVTFVDLAVTGSCSAGYTHRRVFTATDACGKTSTAVQTITTSPDNVGPTFTSLPPVDLMIDCGDPVNVGNATAADACTPNGVTVTNVTTTNGGATGCNTVNGITYGYDVYTTWTAKDACGNVTTAQTNVWVIPNGMAFLAIPDNKTANCGQPMPAWDDAPMVKSTFGPIMSTTFEDIYDLNACGAGTVSRLWTATDDLGNTAQAMQVITLMPDTELPQIFISEPTITVNCDELNAMTQPVVADNCAAVNQIQVEYTDVKVGNTITRTWAATDLCGNRKEANQTITMVDNFAPEFSFVPANETLTCNQTPTNATATAIDNCSDNVVISFTDAVNGNITTRTWSAIDVAGNVKLATQTIERLADNTAPEFSFVPANETLTCNQISTNATASAIDNCSDNVVISFTDAINGNITTRTWSAIDAAGNVKLATQTIERIADNIAPEFSFVPANETLTCGAIPSNANATATDNCSASVVVYFTDVVNGNITTRTWKAVDASGNVKEAVQTIERIPDNTAPTFASTPTNKTIACNEIPVFDVISASDECSVANVTYIDAVNSTVCEQVHTRTWTATDATGNITTAKQVITVKDEVAPAFSFVPENKNLECAVNIQFGTPLATDFCSDIIITQNDEETTPTCGNSGQIITRTWTAMDACGNATTASQSIQILEDVTPPIFSELVDASIEMTLAAFNAWIPTNPASNDDCNNAVNVVATFVQIDECNHEVTYTSSDLCGNTVSQVQKVHITDGSCAPSGTYGLDNSSIKIYPNPASDVLFVESINNTAILGSRYEVIDMWGRILVSGELNTNLESLNLSVLPPANYTLRIFMQEKPIVLMFEKI
jgi:large repetitive protein